MAFDLDPDYKQVPDRIADFKAKHPEGSLRPLNPDRPFDLITIGDQTFIWYVAAAFRTPDDPAPGVGSAWELVPGKTPYTKLSELQNAETSAWGRAIVAVLASESKAVASAEDVRNRGADNEAPDPVISALVDRATALPSELFSALMEYVNKHAYDGQDNGVKGLYTLHESWLPKLDALIAKAEAKATGEPPEAPAEGGTQVEGAETSGTFPPQAGLVSPAASAAPSVPDKPALGAVKKGVAK